MLKSNGQGRRRYNPSFEGHAKKILHIILSLWEVIEGFGTGE